ncbi:MAG: SufD family Fe-S cluster assembly protein [Nanoarchaeota archaeon]
MHSTFASVREEAHALAQRTLGTVAINNAPLNIPQELLPLLERLVSPTAHPHTLLAIATADAVVIDQHQRTLGERIIRFIVLDKDGHLDITPLPGTTLELDIVLIKHGVHATLSALNTTDATIRQEFMIDHDAKLTLVVGHLGAAGTYTRQSTLLGPGASLDDKEFVVGGRDLALDNVVVHAARHTKGDVLQCGVISGGSATATGMLRVLPGSQDTKTFLAEKWLLLSPDARAKAIPGLEIEANDVKASHSATVQPIDEQHVFYLQARGIGKDEARAMIVEGFVGPVIDNWPVVAERQTLRERALATLGRAA